MIELWKSLSDDQMALVGCAAALMVTGTIMSLSYYIGRGRVGAAGQKVHQPLVLDEPSPQILAATAVAAQRRDAA